MLKTKKTRRGATARRFGLDWERQVVQDFKAAGYDQAMSARQGSRLADALGKDIINIYPFACQCKATNSKIPCLKATFDHIKAESTEYKLYALKLRNKGNFAIVEWEDFVELLGMLKKENIL